MKSAIVLGAGITGVSTALALQDRGWTVTLVDRKAPGRETSFGNAGIIQAEAVEPYAMPRSIRELFDIAFGQTNDVFYAFRELPFHVGSLLRYWWHSEEGRHRAAAVAWASLITQATSTHEKLIDRAGVGNLVRKSGFRVLQRTAAEFDAAVKDAERKRQTYGIGYAALSATEETADFRQSLRRGYVARYREGFGRLVELPRNDAAIFMGFLGAAETLAQDAAAGRLSRSDAIDALSQIFVATLERYPPK